MPKLLNYDDWESDLKDEPSAEENQEDIASGTGDGNHTAVQDLVILGDFSHYYAVR